VRKWGEVGEVKPARVEKSTHNVARLMTYVLEQEKEKGRFSENDSPTPV